MKRQRKFSEVAGIFSKAEVPAIIAQNDKKGRVWTGVFACEQTGINIMLNATDNPFSPITGGSMKRVDVANASTEIEFDQSDLEDLVVIARDEENDLVFRADAEFAAQLDGKTIFNPMTGEKMVLAAELEDDEELELAADGDEDEEEDEEVEASDDTDESEENSEEAGDDEDEIEASDEDGGEDDEDEEEASDDEITNEASDEDDADESEENSEEAGDDDADELFDDESGDDEDSDDEDSDDEDESEDEEEDEVVEDEDEDEDESDDEEDEDEDEDEDSDDEDESEDDDSEDEEEDEEVEALFRNFASEANLEDIFSEVAANHVELANIDVVPYGDKYYIFASDTPIAHASKAACSEVAAKIFDKQALYRSALVAAVEKSSDGLNADIVKNFGLTLLETEIPVSEAVANEVARRVDAEKSQLAVEKAAIQGRLEHAFEVACSGFNKGMFGRNALHAGFVAELAQLGLPDAENIVNGVFRKHSEALMKAIVGKAKELASASDDKLNTYAEMAQQREFPTNQGGDFSSSLSRVGVLVDRSEKETASTGGESRFPGLSRRLSRLNRQVN